MLKKPQTRQALPAKVSGLQVLQVTYSPDEEDLTIPHSYQYFRNQYESTGSFCVADWGGKAVDLGRRGPIWMS